MQSATFELSFPNNRETITMPGTGLEVRVFHLELEEFSAEPDQVVIYGDDHGELLAFVATPDDEQLPAFAAAIQWYARYLDYPQMQPVMEDPRPPVRLRRVH